MCIFRGGGDVPWPPWGSVLPLTMQDPWMGKFRNDPLCTWEIMKRSCNGNNNIICTGKPWELWECYYSNSWVFYDGVLNFKWKNNYGETSPKEAAQPSAFGNDSVMWINPHKTHLTHDISSVQENTVDIAWPSGIELQWNIIGQSFSDNEIPQVTIIVLFTRLHLDQ